MADRHEVLADELIHAVEQLAEAFAARPIRYALMGGLATLAVWGDASGEGAA